MKQTINFTNFVDAFRSMGRITTETETGNFNYDGLAVLFDYLEQCEQDTGEEIELDVIALCCDYSQDEPKDIVINYDIDISDCEDEDAIQECVLSYIEDNTAFCGVANDGSIVYAQF